MKQINRIYEALLNRREKVCHKSEIVDIIQEYKRKFKSKINITNTFKYLNRHNYLRRIFQGYYYINSVDERKRGYCSYKDKELLFIVLNKLKIKWYVGLNSALYLAGKFWQVPSVLHILNNKFSGIKKILSLKVKFYKIKEELVFGLKKAVNYSYSIPPKTYLDMVYLRISDKLIKSGQTKKYLKHYPKWVGKK
jgi:predicted transcriptional regulator of viral defense system